MHTKSIKFSYFSHNRRTQGEDAANFDVIDNKGVTHWVWMSEDDIEKNIESFPQCKDELEKGLEYYHGPILH